MAMSSTVFLSIFDFSIDENAQERDFIFEIQDDDAEATKRLQWMGGAGFTAEQHAKGTNFWRAAQQHYLTHLQFGFLKSTSATFNLIRSRNFSYRAQSLQHFSA